MTNKQQREELVATSLERIAITLEKILELVEKDMEESQDDQSWQKTLGELDL